MDKSVLRKKYTNKRKELNAADLEQLSEQIIKQFKSLDLTGLNCLHLFYPIASKNEFNSLLLADWLREHHPQIQLVLPKSDLNNNSLTHIIWTEQTPLAINEWGIIEPVKGETVDAKEIDLVIIPLLAFDTRGNRIGYGKGFYDRFLAECRNEVRKVGISFFEPEDKFNEVNEFDVPLDMCITPEKVWQFC